MKWVSLINFSSSREEFEKDSKFDLTTFEGKAAALYKCCIQEFKEVSNDKEVDILDASNGIIVSLITQMCFGNDMEDLPNKKYPYIHVDGTVKQETIKRIFLNIIPAINEEYYNPLT